MSFLHFFPIAACRTQCFMATLEIRSHTNRMLVARTRKGSSDHGGGVQVHVGGWTK